MERVEIFHVLFLLLSVLSCLLFVALKLLFSSSFVTVLTFPFSFFLSFFLFVSIMLTFSSILSSLAFYVYFAFLFSCFFSFFPFVYFTFFPLCFFRPFSPLVYISSSVFVYLSFVGEGETIELRLNGTACRGRVWFIEERIASVCGGS